MRLQIDIYVRTAMNTTKKKISDKDIWEFQVCKRNEICYTPESIRHPAKMHLQMCREIIKRYSKRGDLILDPFMGSGTTAKIVRDLGRNYVGIELNKKYIKLAEERLGQKLLF
ncbi:MAG: site-specific DNA-methyltransferase [Bacteroidetes bacterium]|nr:site-specific DNA-methyltransferase [Bacteroidota bacterium]